MVVESQQGLRWTKDFDLRLRLLQLHLRLDWLVVFLPPGSEGQKKVTGKPPPDWRVDHLQSQSKGYCSVAQLQQREEIPVVEDEHRHPQAHRL